MPSLKDLKNRISSVKSTQKITSAMKMVAAAKLRRAQDQALASRPYTSLMDKIVSKISSKATGTSIDLLTGKPENKTQLLVVFSADRGLCGGFNGSITRNVKKEINDLQKNNVNVKLLMVGKKSADSLNREYGNLFIDKIEGKSALLIAGGVGITPIRALLEELPMDVETDLIWRASHEQDLSLREEVEELAKRRGTRIHYMVGSRKHFPLNEDRLKRAVPHILETDIFLCGPEGMVEEAKNSILELGVDPDRLHDEAFAY